MLDGEAADILIEGDAIKEVGLPGLAAPEGAEAIEAAEMMLIPGLVNAHTHGDVSLAKGLGDRLTLELLLNATPLTSERFRLEDKYLAAKLSAVEMVLSGCTACYDLFSEFPAPSPDGLAAVHYARRRGGIPVVITVPGHDIKDLAAGREDWRRVETQALEGATTVIAVSEELAQLVRQLGIAPDKVRVIHNGVDGEVFKPTGSETGREGKRRLLYVGRGSFGELAGRFLCP